MAGAPSSASREEWLAARHLLLVFYCRNVCIVWRRSLARHHFALRCAYHRWRVNMAAAIFKRPERHACREIMVVKARERVLVRHRNGKPETLPSDRSAKVSVSGAAGNSCLLTREM